MLTTLLGLAEGRATAQDDAAHVRAKLAGLPQPWKEPVHRITLKEYEATLAYWAEQHPDILTVERIGVSQDGIPISLLTVTDRDADPADKQVCLITALHGGPERSGTTTALHLVEWLLGQTPEAAEVRRRQIVALIPIINPRAFFVTDRFGNAEGIDPYTGGGAQNWDLETMTYKALDQAPELKAFLSVVDRFQPDVHIDLHGTGLQEYPPEKLGSRTRYRGQTMFEVTGSAYSNYALRPWDWRITEAMIAAGVEAGFPSDRFEADAQRCYWGPSLDPIADRLWRGRPQFYSAHYGYAKYHTMVSALEIGWEASGVARVQGLLKIGNNVWDGEAVAGYPVNRVASFLGHYVTAWGPKADQRRRSRVELWQRQAEFSHAVLYPQTDGRDTYILATSDEAATLLDENPEQFLENLKARDEIRTETIAEFLAAGPEIKLVVDRARPKSNATGTDVKNGVGLRLRLPYRNPKLVDLRLNGHLLQPSSTDGYQTWFGNGFTQVQINIPPEKAQAADLFIITCAYQPDVKRDYGWSPPAEVVERLQGAGD